MKKQCGNNIRLRGKINATPIFEKSPCGFNGCSRYLFAKGEPFEQPDKCQGIDGHSLFKNEWLITKIRK